MRPADAPPPMLCARGLASRRGHCAPVDFELHGGQLLHVRGANGSGKTSLLRMLAGLLRPLAGSVLWRGGDARSDPSSYRACMAYLGHGNGLCGELSAAENLRYALHIAGTPLAETRILHALRAWRLESCAKVPALRLSQGQGRRLALAAVVLGGKPLWLLDEPDAGLDSASLAQLSLALETHLAAGGAVVLASHREPGCAAAHVHTQTQTLDMDDYADAGYAVAVGIA
ncbi:heme ABC exporter ATP-binding protein CcmA [Achromobacter pestifer]|uniref:Heme ABC exporter ATP-binding protein CcmA n=1 Tax=Achromobacter pestifer TaxID=1353889 RepID=A0A7D4DVH6_9BURK|nr:heme ABC exporter ATP-binding protein CcmA [Achromobacter pestifer]QKH33527.1 heme ABC exporter ATP-binding protein CcmA [Achromobacter pestifer]